jgi:hypothetical protein
MSLLPNLHLVFSTPPPAIGDEMYNAWYDYHVHEILRAPGYEAVRRYQVVRHSGTREPAGQRFLSAYAIGDDLPRMAANLAAERPHMDLPRWFGSIRFASWVAELLPGYAPPVLTDRLQFVFCSEPSDVSQERYENWYRRYLREQAGADGLEHGWQFRVRAPKPPDGPVAMTRLAVFPLAGRADGPDRAPARGPADVPGWFGRIDVSSVEARAIGDRIESA